MELELHPFEHSSTTALFKINAEWHLTNDNVLHLHSRVEGPVPFLDFDPSTKAQAKDNLWQKTCFEFFVLERNSTQYMEWNFSPAGDFQRYMFSNYRERKPHPEPTTQDAQTKWAISGEFFDFRAEVALPFEIQKIQICWVLKPKQENPSYWALDHTSEKADFHNIDAFHQCGA